MSQTPHPIIPRPHAETQKYNEALKRVWEAAEGGVLLEHGNVEKPRDIQLAREIGCVHPIMRDWSYLAHDIYDSKEAIWQETVPLFLTSYLKKRFARQYCLGGEFTLDYLSGTQRYWSGIQAYNPVSNQALKLPYGVTLSLIKDSEREYLNPAEVMVVDELRLMCVEEALSRVSTEYIESRPVEVAAALNWADPQVLKRKLQESPRRGALAHALKRASEQCFEESRWQECFAEIAKGTATRPKSWSYSVGGKISPASGQLGFRAGGYAVLYDHLAGPIRGTGPKIKPLADPRAVLQAMDRGYKEDAYHSLTIEGYRVTREMIDRIARGEWNPMANSSDQARLQGAAIKGYNRAFQQVRSVVETMLDQGSHPGERVRANLLRWQEELFHHYREAGLQEPPIGYRESSVYITNRQFVFPPSRRVPELMEVFMTKLSEEKCLWTAGVMAHYFTVYIHPFTDGNGRCARFAMNVCWAALKLPWVTVPSERREVYFHALDQAASEGDLRPFSNTLAIIMEDGGA